MHGTDPLTNGCQQLRLAWCDLHGQWHAKTLLPRAFEGGLSQGIRMASSLMLKDSSGRTAFPVFEPGGMAGFEGLQAFADVGDVWLKPDLSTLKRLPWATDTAWVQCDAHTLAGEPIGIDPRQVLRNALARLAQRGHGLRVGLEVEFHVYRLSPNLTATRHNPATTQWPGDAPSDPDLSLLHPGYQLLSESYADQAHEVLTIVQRTCAGLGLPLASLEIEMGPSQFEAVFDVQGAMEAADAMVLFRSATRQALARAGYHASFMCRPPFGQIMSSGWHVHQSWTLACGRNSFDDTPFDNPTEALPSQALSALGMHCVAGLLAHAPALAAIAVPTVNGFARFRPKALAPQTASWGTDSRSAMLRVVGHGAAARIENRLPEPMANPYLLLAAQIFACLDGVSRQAAAPAPDGSAAAQAATPAPSLPTSQGTALDALQASAVLRQGLGNQVVDWYLQIKRQEASRHAASADSASWQRAEYFGNY